MSNQPTIKPERPLPIAIPEEPRCYICDRPIEPANKICDVCASPMPWNGKVYV